MSVPAVTQNSPGLETLAGDLQLPRGVCAIVGRGTGNTQMALGP